MTPYERLDLVLGAIQAGAVCVGFWYAHAQLRLLQLDLRNSVELAGRQHAMELIARYADPEAAARRHRLRTLPEVQKDYHECCALLNALEEVAIAHKHETANRVLLKDGFASAVRGWLDKPYIEDALEKARAKDPARYENLLDLYLGWGGGSPRLRRIRELPTLVTR